MNRLSREDFIEKSKKIHGDRFDYDDVIYDGYKNKITLKCSKHGEFITTASNHLITKSGGCKKCGLDLNGESHKKNTEDFIKKAKKIHGNFYDYSKTEYEHSLKTVEIICPTHGMFSIRASNHINNKQGCPKCGNIKTKSKNRKTIQSFIDEISDKDNFENYDFSNIVQFENIRSEIRPICKLHGEYTTTPRGVINSKYFGCRECKTKDDRFTTDDFVKISKQTHGDKYIYENVDYYKAHELVKITCKEHGDYECKPYIHMAGGGFCPKCTPFVSSYEMEISDFLKDIGIDDVENTVKKFDGISEVDIFSENHGVGIEFDGLYWHSELFKDKKYHKEKTKRFKELGYKMIHIFEDEWVYKKDIWKSVLKNYFDKSGDRIYARKTIIKEVSYKESEKFLDENHLQGNCVSKYRYGLYSDDKLVSLMTFGKLRKNMGSENKEGEFELLRFCNKTDTVVVGGASKLFKHFIANVSPTKIVSFSDLRYSNGDLYEKLGFVKQYDTNPNYYYFKGLNRYNRYTFRKDVLVSRGHPKEKTEREIMKDLGYTRIYDCGSGKYTWSNNN